MKRFISLLLCVVLCGCVTTNFEEAVLDADGSSATTSYSAQAIVPPFSKLEPSNHLLDYEWGGNRIRIGQESEGIDATGQIAALGVVIEALVALAPYIGPVLEVLNQAQPDAAPNITISPLAVP